METERNNTRKYIIAGTRTFKNYEFLKSEVRRILAERPGTNFTIISGGAQGADKLGEKFANEHKIPCTIYSARWEKFGKSAGPIRNIEMANAADGLIAFWDGESKGTLHMIEAMRERQKEIHVISVKGL